MNKTTKMKTVRKFDFDIERFPAVVFESDDWGSAQNLPDLEQKEAFDNIVGAKPYYPKLESRKEMLALFSVLEKHRGADGLKPVITAFTCMGNPDYDAIRANGFTKYEDISVEHGFPAGWDGMDVVKTWKEGIARDVWHPEYHAFFHHISAKLWLKLLKEDSKEGLQARQLFEMNNFSLPYHLPEYDGFTEAEAEAFIKEGFARFERLFGYRPSAAVTSDAYPWTIRLWAEAGIKTACLTNFRLNNGEVVYYQTKPWNFQDPDARCGDYDVEKNIIYMTRNVWFEPHDSGVPAEEAFAACENNFTKYKDPAIIQPHRINYCVFPEDIAEKRLKELDRLLEMLSNRGVYFLTTAELSDIYRQGYSKRKLSNGTVLRKWTICDLDKDYGEATDLSSGRKVVIKREMTGNFLLHEQTEGC